MCSCHCNDHHFNYYAKLSLLFYTIAKELTSIRLGRILIFTFKLTLLFSQERCWQISLLSSFLCIQKESVIFKLISHPQPLSCHCQYFPVTNSLHLFPLIS